MAKFNKLDVPHQWKDEFTKYPHGYTIFEALCKWVNQVDNMVDNINNWNDYLDNFVNNFEFELQEEVQSTIERWQNEGLLDGIIESALNTELDNVKTQLAETTTKVFDASEKLHQSNYYQEVTTKKHSDSESNTYYYLTLVKHKDSSGELIKLEHANFQYDQKTIRSFAVENNATVAFNAGYTIGGRKFSGLTMKDGVVLDYTPLSSEELGHRYILGIKEDNTMMSFPGDTSVSELQNNGIVNAVTTFIPLIQNGRSVSSVLLNVYHMGEKHPRQVVAQFPNKDILIMTTGGRGFDGDGMTATDVVRILLERGVTFAHMLDGGGSTSTVVRGVHINHPTDQRGSYERKHAHALYIAKPRTDLDRDKDIAQLNQQLGIISNRVDSKANRYNIFGDNIDPLMNEWDGGLAVRMDELANIHLYGSIVVGNKGSTQSVFAQLPERYIPIVNVTGSMSEANPPWTAYSGVVVGTDGIVRLRGEANTVATGTRIHINMVYKGVY